MSVILYPRAPQHIVEALQRVVQVQQAGGLAAWLDLPHDFDVAGAKSAGVDVGLLLISQPESLQEAEDLVRHLERTECVDLIVVTQPKENEPCTPSTP